MESHKNRTTQYPCWGSLLSVRWEHLRADMYTPAIFNIDNNEVLLNSQGTLLTVTCSLDGREFEEIGYICMHG